MFTPIPLLVAPCAGGTPTLPSTEFGFQGLFQTTANITEGPTPVALGPSSINLNVAP